MWSSRTQATFENLRLELRRGSLILAVLGALRIERYGYTLRKTLEDAGMPVDEGTLYPLLRRLETQGLLESRWRIDEARPRRYYILSPQGVKLLPRLKSEWQNLVSLLNQML